MANFSRIFVTVLIALIMTSCSTTRSMTKQSNELIKPEQFAVDRMAGIDRSVALGPKLDLTQKEITSTRERVRIDKQEQKNYIDIGDGGGRQFPVSLNFENVNIRDAMSMFSEVTGVNILVGDDVDGKVTAKLENVPWDTGLDSVLKMKGLAKHVDNTANIIRIHKRDVLIEHEEYDRKRIQDLRKTLEAQNSVKPLYTEIFKLFYTKAEIIKAEIEGLLGSSSSTSEGTEGGSTGIGITVDSRLNSIIVKTTEQELDLISKLIGQLDVRTKQVLIEAFIVEANDDFRKELGTRLGYNATNLGNIDGDRFGVSSSGVIGESSGAPTIGTTTGNVTNLAAAGATSGIGFLLNSTSSALKIELTAMESEGVTKILSNPRVFTLNNEKAIVKQGWEIAYPVTSDGELSYEFKEAMLIMTVTPSIVGDGNIILDIVIEKKDADTSKEVPPIQSESITTKLLVKDGTVVVIGGVRKQKLIDSTDKVPWLADVPIIGNLFKHKKDTDQNEELLIFIAPRVI
ncbi:Type IV pilus biogenesis protein PilQ [hydrothermal vent metagenome]|uniref:Type IV pilus biogenesis protein PilQ n=1 Tax=hydrothermal vent metagenome TaxID=652676 RepID=A0A1W1DA58_9ZZZZ